MTEQLRRRGAATALETKMWSRRPVRNQSVRVLKSGPGHLTDDARESNRKGADSPVLETKGGAFSRKRGIPKLDEPWGKSSQNSCGLETREG